MATIKSLQSALARVGTQTKQVAMQRIVLAAERIAKQEAPVKQGTLRRSITSRVERGGDRGIIGTNIKYAQAVHDGSRPHTIRPNKAKALFWKGAKHPVRVVNHPGNKPNPFFDRTRDKLRPIAEREAASVFDAALGSIT